eukprot:CAMPEP_0206478392 /NCGR_PEP_ID=MMETSP0324_2-20121206/35995_1 /ASSEMBLY_ACC=CAM_ASM_000836 /TAXON_ID=2866 /ORGANISM="Crypthecodinium cohnii, Strain Seligo" /LENGTH=105 /DNA_ID=CAMNT_0053954627 /DNA_START=222 /DNA_END=539 /DNA_ORIENTATION=+
MLEQRGGHWHAACVQTTKGKALDLADSTLGSIGALVMGVCLADDGQVLAREFEVALDLGSIWPWPMMGKARTDSRLRGFEGSRMGGVDRESQEVAPLLGRTTWAT